MASGGYDAKSGGPSTPSEFEARALEYVEAGGLEACQVLFRIFLEHREDILATIFNATDYGEAMEQLLKNYEFMQLDIHFIMSLRVQDLLAHSTLLLRRLLELPGD